MVKRKATADKQSMEIGVEFGGVSIGEATARIGIRVLRGAVTLAQMDEMFTGRRLTGRVVRVRAGDLEGQGKLVDDMDHSIDGTFDSKRIGVTLDHFSAGLTFLLSEIDVTELAALAKGAGRLEITGVDDIPSDEDEKE